MRNNKQEENQIQKLKDEAKYDIEQRRENLRKKIAAIKAKVARRKRQIEQDINVIRSKMAQNLMAANKKGDKQKCISAYGNESKITSYCNENIVDDFNKNVECKDPTGFCYICCENEIGQMYIIDRDECYSMCDNLSRSALDHGEFKWGQ